MRTRTIGLIVAIVLLTAACSSGDDGAAPTTTTTTTTTTTIPTTTTVPAGRRPATLAAFAPFEEIPLLVDEPAYAGPPTPTSLDDVDMPPGFPLTGAQESALITNGFVIVPTDYRQFQQSYEGHAWATLFVTTDAAYHAMHLAFSKVLRETEQGQLLPRLETLLRKGLDAAMAQRTELAATDLADAADRVAQLYQAAGSLLGLDVGQLGPLAQKEVALAREAAQLTASPLTSFRPCNPLQSMANCVDYSLFTPRGHYTRNEDLQRYFRAMSLLGSSAFFLDDDQSLRLGLLASRVLARDSELTQLWKLIYEPTAFMVGAADDYTPIEVADAASAVAPGWTDNPASLATRETVTAVADKLRARRSVSIDKEAASVRLMGARFVIDSYVYDQLRWPFVGTSENRRTIASPLDLASLMGSKLARTVQATAGETQYPNYQAQLDALQGVFDTREPSQWAGTVYDAWLYALEPSWTPKGLAYPDMMHGEAWAAKDLQTGAASYAELRHDTILYAKQSFAAEGGGDLGYKPRHWVEPNPVAFRRMSQVLTLTRDGLTVRGLLEKGDEQDALLESTAALCDRLARLADDELARRPISDEDNNWLAGFAPILEAQWVQSSDIDPDIGLPSAQDSDASIIADIMRSTDQIVEVGTGRIDSIFVLVPDDNDRFQLAFGGVYSYYEFTRTASDGRLTDEEWRGLLDTRSAPERPSWIGPVVATG